jgi:hypothetical protein
MSRNTEVKGANGWSVDEKEDVYIHEPLQSWEHLFESGYRHRCTSAFFCSMSSCAGRRSVRRGKSLTKLYKVTHSLRMYPDSCFFEIEDYLAGCVEKCSLS